MMPVNPRPLRFGLRFIVGFAVLMGAFEASRGTAFEKFVVEDAILSPSAALLNTLTPGEPVELHGRTRATNTSKLHVTRGCEGIEMFLLLAAAILAFPAGAGRRVQGFFMGAVLAYILSVMRLVMLDYSLRYFPNTWEVLHGLVLPLGPIIVMALFFLRWSAVSAATLRSAQSHHAT